MPFWSLLAGNALSVKELLADAIHNFKCDILLWYKYTPQVRSVSAVTPVFEY